MGRLKEAALKRLAAKGGAGGLFTSTVGAAGKALYGYGIISTLGDIASSTLSEEGDGFNAAATRAAAGWGPWIGMDLAGRGARRAAPKLLAKAAAKQGLKKAAMLGAGRLAGGLAYLSNPLVGTALMAAPVVLPLLKDKIMGKDEEQVDPENPFEGLSPYERQLLRREIYKQQKAKRLEELQAMGGYDYEGYEE